MPPKGKNKPTPMVVFMNEMRDEMEVKHKKKFRIPFDEELYTLCKPFYDELDENQKQYYKDQAKAEWTGIRHDKNKKLTSHGIPVAVYEKEALEKERKKKVESMEIEKQFNFDLSTILPMEIVVIHVNWFCKVTEDKFIPAEVALAKFSLRDGLIDTYHCFPSYELPLGTKGDSVAHSNRTHQIPALGFTEKVKKCEVIFREIMKFLAKNNQRTLPEGACYPIYTMSDDLNDITSRNAVRSFLNDIVSAVTYDDTERDDPNEKYFKLCDLSKLLYVLKMKDPHTNPIHAQFMDENLMAIFLRKDTFLQSPQIACSWHDERDLIPKCSQSRCIAWVYHICDQLQFMDYRMVPGKHMPHNAKLEEEETHQNRHGAYNADYDDADPQYAESDNDDYAGSVASGYDRDFPDQMTNLNLGRRQY